MNKTRLVFLLVVLLALAIVGSGLVYNLYTDYKTTQIRLATAEAKWALEGSSQAMTQAEATTRAVQSTLVVAEASARSTAQSAQSTATAAMRIAEEAKVTSCDAPVDSQAIPRQPRVAVTPPPIFAYAAPFDTRGTGPFSVKGGEQKLFHYRFIGDRELLVFVKCLFLYVSIPSSPDSAPATLDFSIWGPSSGGWSINGSKNKLNWGENIVEIENPDSLVSRQSDIYLSVRNYGIQSLAIQQMNLTLWLINSDDTYTVIKPISK